MCWSTTACRLAIHPRDFPATCCDSPTKRGRGGGRSPSARLAPVAARHVSVAPLCVQTTHDDCTASNCVASRTATARVLEAASCAASRAPQHRGRSKDGSAGVRCRLGRSSVHCGCAVKSSFEVDRLLPPKVFLPARVFGDVQPLVPSRPRIRIDDDGLVAPRGMGVSRARR